MLNMKFVSAGPISRDFRDSDAEVSLLLGPYGSGKSVTGIHTMFRNIMNTKPDSDGIRRWHGVVIRNTYQMLTTNTIELFNEHVPKEFGKIKLGSPIRKTIEVEGYEITIDFLAMDKDADKRRVEGGNYNFAWIDESRELPWSVVQTLMTRVRVTNDQGEEQPLRIIFTSNPSSTRHWMYEKFVELDIPGWSLFKQPGGREPNAENKKFLKKGYYEQMVASNDPSFVKVHVDNEWGQEVIGAAVVPDFNEEIHVASEVIPILPHFPLVIGLDAGPTLNSAAVIGQIVTLNEADGKVLGNQLRILHEIYFENMGAIRAAEYLQQQIKNIFPGMKVDRVIGDPAMFEQRDCTEEIKYYKIWRGITGYNFVQCPTNKTHLRVDGLRGIFQRLINGKPSILIDPGCKDLIAALEGEYRWKQKSTPSGITVSETEIDKNNKPFVDLGDAIGYLAYGTSEFDALRETSRKGNQNRSSRIILADGAGGAFHDDLYGESDDIFR